MKSPPPSGTIPLHFLTLKIFLYTFPLYSQLFVLNHQESFSKKDIGIFTQIYEMPKWITSHPTISKNIIQKCESSNTGIFTSYNYVFISLSFQVTLFLNIVKIKEYKNTMTKKASGIGYNIDAHILKLPILYDIQYI